MKTFSLLPRTSPYRVALETYEKGMVERALEAAGGNVQLTAERLGVSRKYLYDRFAQLGIPVRNPRPARIRRGRNGSAPASSGGSDGADLPCTTSGGAGSVSLDDEE